MPSIRQWINKIVYGSRIPFQATPLSFYTDMMERNVPFSFSRFGDGEWSSILGKTGANCDGHEYFPELSRMLQEAVKAQSSYIYGLQSFAIRSLGKYIYKYIRQNNINIQWRNSDVFHYANIAGKLNPLVRQMRNHPVVMVGPEYLRPISGNAFSYKNYVEIPSSNCFTAISAVEKEIRAYGTGKKGIIYAFSASMAANCIIHNLYNDFGEHNWLIDFGSLWDIYVGKKSRSVYRRDGWDEVIKRNCT